MNKNIDLTQILKDCPKGTKFYTSVWGYVTFIEIKKDKNCWYPICIKTDAYSYTTNLTKDGRYLNNPSDSECIIFPSKEQRDWSKFTAPWHKKEKFDPKTLKPFDRVLIRANNKTVWEPDFFGYIDGNWVMCVAAGSAQCAPYNDETKHLVGTTEEAPEYYKYWED